MDEDHEKITLKIKDNGVGFSEQFEKGEYGSPGIGLIKLFAEQLEANLHIENNNGVDALYFHPAALQHPGHLSLLF